MQISALFLKSCITLLPFLLKIHHSEVKYLLDNQSFNQRKLCNTSQKSALGHSVFSVTASQKWNSVPVSIPLQGSWKYSLLITSYVYISTATASSSCLTTVLSWPACLSMCFCLGQRMPVSNPLCLLFACALQYCMCSSALYMCFYCRCVCSAIVCYSVYFTILFYVYYTYICFVRLPLSANLSFLCLIVSPKSSVTEKETNK